MDHGFLPGRPPVKGTVVKIHVHPSNKKTSISLPKFCLSSCALFKDSQMKGIISMPPSVVT